MYKPVMSQRKKSFSFLNNLNVTLIFLAMFSIIVVLVYEVKFLFHDIVFHSQIDQQDIEWNKFKSQLTWSGFLTGPNENLSNFNKRIQKVTRIKVSNLFNDMNSENLEKYLKNFYLKGERRYSIVLSSWRSGSSFFGDFLQSVPGTFYHYEPLINHIHMLRSPNDVFGLKRVESFINCNFENATNYFEFMSRSYAVFQNSHQLGNIYEENKDIAVQEKFVKPICDIYPFQSMKVIRLGLESFRDLLKNNKLNIKIILLIRDPRAVMNSRRVLKFCMDTPDCAKPATLCQDMVDDYKSALDLTQKYPQNLK